MFMKNALMGVAIEVFSILGIDELPNLLLVVFFSFVLYLNICCGLFSLLHS